MIKVALLCGALASQSMIAAPKRVMKVGTATVTENSFHLAVKGIRESVFDKARVHKALENRVVVFLPGVRTRRMNRRFAEGPIEGLKIRRLERGTVIVLNTRIPGDEVLGALDFTRRPDMGIQVSVDQADQAAPSPKEVVTETAVPVTGAVASTRVKTADNSVLFKNHDSKEARPALATGRSSMAATGFIGMILALLGATAWLLKRGKSVETTDDSISVVAVRGLGGKHKLALVETCGEKLLLATSDKEVRLLSHVGSDLLRGEALPVSGFGGSEEFEDVSGIDDQDDFEPCFSPSVSRKPATEEMTLDIAELMKKRTKLSADLDGLVKLRQKKGKQKSEAMSTPGKGGMFRHLSRKYKKTEAAA